MLKCISTLTFKVFRLKHAGSINYNEHKARICLLKTFRKWAFGSDFIAETEREK